MFTFTLLEGVNFKEYSGVNVDKCLQGMMSCSSFYNQLMYLVTRNE